MEEEFDWRKINPVDIFNWIIAITIVVMICFLIFSIVEYTSAKTNCEKINGTYKLKNLNHYCDGEPFYKYSEGDWYWDKNYSNQIDYLKFG